MPKDKGVTQMKRFPDYTEDLDKLSAKHQKVVTEQIGKTYGFLTIDSFACMNRHELYFNCTCECGNKRVVKYLYLKNGHNKSCGCKRGQVEPGAIERDDLTGQTFGLWTVLHRDTSRTDIPYYICRCACGTEKSVNKYNLKNGTSWHCGCQKEKVKAEAAEKYKERFYNGELAATPQDLSGRRFGRLVVLEKLPYDRDKVRSTKVPYRCRCDCGNEFTATYGNLVLGDTKSCGCRMKEVAEKTIKTAQAVQEYPDGTSISGIKSALRGVLSSRNTSGVRGVSVVRASSKRSGSKGTASSISSTSSAGTDESAGEDKPRYRATITFKKKVYVLGIYDTLEMAARARKLAEDRLFGEFLEEYEGSELQAEVKEENREKLKEALDEITEFCQAEERQSRQKGCLEELKKCVSAYSGSIEPIEPIDNHITDDVENVENVENGENAEAGNGVEPWIGHNGVLWNCILAFAGEKFTTSGRGETHAGAVEFDYVVKKSRRTGEYTDELIISTRDSGKTVTRSTVELGFRNALKLMESESCVNGPKALGIPGAGSYLYAIFLNWGIIKDRRVNVRDNEEET